MKIGDIVLCNGKEYNEKFWGVGSEKWDWIKNTARQIHWFQWMGVKLNLANVPCCQSVDYNHAAMYVGYGLFIESRNGTVKGVHLTTYNELFKKRYTEEWVVYRNEKFDNADRKRLHENALYFIGEKYGIDALDFLKLGINHIDYTSYCSELIVKILNYNGTEQRTELYTEFYEQEVSPVMLQSLFERNTTSYIDDQGQELPYNASKVKKSCKTMANPYDNPENWNNLIDVTQVYRNHDGDRSELYASNIKIKIYESLYDQFSDISNSWRLAYIYHDGMPKEGREKLITDIKETLTEDRHPSVFSKKIYEQLLKYLEYKEKQNFLECMIYCRKSLVWSAFTMNITFCFPKCIRDHFVNIIKEFWKGILDRCAHTYIIEKTGMYADIKKVIKSIYKTIKKVIKFIYKNIKKLIVYVCGLIICHL